jgi:hypothetical protein
MNANIREQNGKHYTSREETGLSATEQKEKAILFELQMCCLNDLKILRYYLRLAIGKGLSQLMKKPTEKSTIYHFIEYLLNMGYIEQNPTSHITENNNILPDNMTRYFLNAEKIDARMKELIIKEFEFQQKGKISPSLTLDSFKNEDCHSRSENQKEEKSNLSNKFN